MVPATFDNSAGFLSGGKGGFAFGAEVVAEENRV